MTAPTDNHEINVSAADDNAATEKKPAPHARRKRAWLNPLGVAALILALVFAALIVHNERRERSAADLLPQSTEFYFFTPLAKKSAAPPVEKFAMWDDLRHEFFGVLPLETAIVFAQSLTHYGAAQLPEGKALIIRCDNAWELKKFFAGAKFAQQPLPSEFPDDYQIQINGQPRYFAILNPYAVFSANPEIIAEILACWRKTAPSLGNGGWFSAGAAAANSADFFWRLANSAIVNGQGDHLFRAPENFTANLAVAGTLTWNSKKFFTTGKIVDLNTLAAPVKRGFGDYALWTLAIVVGVVIGLPALFLFSVFAVAVWFHIDSRIRGINCPRIAPVLPPLSNELREDLAAPSPPSNSGRISDEN